MRRLRFIIERHCAHKDEHSHEGEKPYGEEANVFSSKEFKDYVKRYGHHFTDALAEYASRMMVNASGHVHTWTAAQVKKAMTDLGLTVPATVTTGDLTYLANMYYADFYPDPLKDEVSCLKAAHKIANDPDGYEGMVFNRWMADVMSKSLEIDWEDF